MFDRTIINSLREDRVVEKTVTIHEHRAPTDDSIRLAGEYQKAAEESVVCRGEVRNNDLAARWAVMQDFASAMMDYKVAIRVRLNGKEHVLRFSLERQHAKTQQDVVLFVRDKVAELVANQLLEAAFKDAEVVGAIRSATGRG